MRDLTCLAIISLTMGVLQAADPGRQEVLQSDSKQHRWSCEKASRWYSEQPWPCGFNYVPACAISYTEMWMDYNFDPKLIDKELALAEGIGFNCLRVVLPFVVWEHDPEAFKRRVDTFLRICERRGLRVMLTLFDDCGEITDPKCEKQPDVVVGWYANGWSASPGHGIVRDPQQWPRLERYVTDLIKSFKNDQRVWVWDLYNEPTNSGMGNVSVPLVEKVFGWARQNDPGQPLIVAQWNGNATLNKVIHPHSDITTFHSYGSADDVAKCIADLKKHGRPIINTEWLNRRGGSRVADCLPVFVKENVGCMHWGLVNGRTQTHLSWGHRPGQPDPPFWQHDLFRGNHEPYDATELKLFRQAMKQH